MAKTLLYTVHLSRHAKGMVKGPVPAVPAKGILFDLSPDGAQVVPDMAAIAQCLPARYRKAMANAALSQINGRDGFHISLYGSRHRYLNTVYCLPTLV